MTTKQKIILLVLATVAVVLLFGVYVLHTYMDRSPQPITAVTATPTIEPTRNPIVIVVTLAPSKNPQDVTPTPTPMEETITLAPTGSVTEPDHTYNPGNTPAGQPSQPTATPKPTVPSGMAFTLTILGKNIPVAGNVEAATLEAHPGWLPTSVKPGKEGVCVVYGHRNRSHLLVLKDIDYGDKILVIMPDGKSYTYIVEQTEILESNEELRIPTIEGKHLILMTCYPFYYSGHAPKKFVVTCTLDEPLESSLIG